MIFKGMSIEFDVIGVDIDFLAEAAEIGQLFSTVGVCLAEPCSLVDGFHED